MRIRVKLFGLLAIHVGLSDYTTMMELDISEGMTYYDVAVALSLPMPAAVMFSVGGILKRPSELVNDGDDEVQIFMPLAGG